MNIHEHQAKQILKKYGAIVPEGVFALSVDELVEKAKLVNMMTPLYFARIAGFITETKDMTNGEAEKVVEEQAEMFENSKDYLLQRWSEKGKEEIS